MNKIEEIKKAASGLKVSDRLFCYSTLIRNTQESVWVKLKQKMTTGRLEWNDIQREIDILNNELKQLETDKPQYGK